MRKTLKQIAIETTTDDKLARYYIKRSLDNTNNNNTTIEVDDYETYFMFTDEFVIITFFKDEVLAENRITNKFYTTKHKQLILSKNLATAYEVFD